MFNRYNHPTLAWMLDYWPATIFLPSVLLPLQCWRWSLGGGTNGIRLPLMSERGLPQHRAVLTGGAGH